MRRVGQWKGTGTTRAQDEDERCSRKCRPCRRRYSDIKQNYNFSCRTFLWLGFSSAAAASRFLRPARTAANPSSDGVLEWSDIQAQSVFNRMGSLVGASFVWKWRLNKKTTRREMVAKRSPGIQTNFAQLKREVFQAGSRHKDTGKVFLGMI